MWVLRRAQRINRKYWITDYECEA